MKQLNRRDFVSLIGKTGVLSLFGSNLLMANLLKGSQHRPMNVLFIAVDDLRPQLGCYNYREIKSPNIDLLAETSMLFTNAYCQSAMCRPSRNSLLSGLRPDSFSGRIGTVKCAETASNVVMLPEHFKNHGYHTQALGKIFHGGYPNCNEDHPSSWSVPSWMPMPFYYHTADGMAIAKACYEKRTGATGDEWKSDYKAWGLVAEAPDVPDNQLYDGRVADRAIQTLREVKDKPFFLATGFVRPHLPFVAPKKYWDMYKRESIELPENNRSPEGTPDWTNKPWAELGNYVDSKGCINSGKARELIHGYYACVSFVDAQIGRVIDELDVLGLKENTIIILWGDHGWKLGEYGSWSKHTNFECDTHAPLILRVPEQKTLGRKCSELVEFVDIYPTLSELCGFPIPDHCEGTSMVPLLQNPILEWKSAAFSQYFRSGNNGHTMRTKRYRYTEWANNGEIVFQELYDHKNDPGENVNIVNRQGNRELVKTLSQKLHDGWQNAAPAK